MFNTKAVTKKQKKEKKTETNKKKRTNVKGFKIHLFNAGPKRNCNMHTVQRSMAKQCWQSIKVQWWKDKEWSSEKDVDYLMTVSYTLAELKRNKTATLWIRVNVCK